MPRRRLGLHLRGELGAGAGRRGFDLLRLGLGQAQVGLVGFALGGEIVQPGQKIVVGNGDEVGFSHVIAPVVNEDSGGTAPGGGRRAESVRLAGKGSHRGVQTRRTGGKAGGLGLQLRQQGTVLWQLEPPLRRLGIQLRRLESQ
ncbi:hypothetical protein [Methylomagnum sp.]